MDRATLKQAIAGGYIEQYGLDMGKSSFSMRVDVLDNGVLSRYDMRLEGITRFAYESESESTGDRLELTDIWIEMAPEQSGTEEWHILISIWDLTHIRIQCARIVVDDEALR
jgi:hypothetical protein